MIAPLAALLLVALSPQDHAARVDAFLAALPPSDDADGPDQEAIVRADTDAKRLIAANPGKEAAIRAAMAGRVKCGEDYSANFVKSSLRRVAESLGDADLDKLTAFYSGPDYQRMVAAGEDAPLTKELTDKYPLMRFYEATQKVMGQATSEAIDAFATCEAKADAALAAAGIKND